MRTKTRSLLVLIPLVFAVGPARADLLALYNFNDNNALVDSVDSNVTASDMGLNGTTPAATSNFDGSINSYDDPNEAFMNASSTTLQYYEFTLSAVSLDLAFLGFTFDTERTGSGRLTTLSLQWMDGNTNPLLSFDAYNSDQTDFDNLPVSPTLNDVTTFTIGSDQGDIQNGSVVADLSGLASANSFTFRINFAGPGSLVAQSSFDDLQVTGLAIPEPSSIVLLGLAGLSMALGRRLRR